MAKTLANKHGYQVDGNQVKIINFLQMLPARYGHLTLLWEALNHQNTEVLNPTSPHQQVKSPTLRFTVCQTPQIYCPYFKAHSLRI